MEKKTSQETFVLCVSGELCNSKCLPKLIYIAKFGKNVVVRM